VVINISVSYMYTSIRLLITGSECHVMTIKIPIDSEDDVVQQYEDYFTNHPEIRLAHIGIPYFVIKNC